MVVRQLEERQLLQREIARERRAHVRDLTRTHRELIGYRQEEDSDPGLGRRYRQRKRGMGPAYG
jgi:hypothetical protein